MPNNAREFVRRISSQDLELYPQWDLSIPLPRLPVPELRPTLEKYLRLIAPVTSPTAFGKTRKIVGDFLLSGGQGEQLQALLRKRAESQENWVNDWWLEDMYLYNPLSLPINSNPGMVFPQCNFTSFRQQIRYAAQFISGILDYKEILDTRSLPIDRASHSKKGQPMCMEQYYRLFTSYRYPGEEKDQLQTNVTKDPFEPETITVVYRGQFFVIDAIINETRLGEEEVYMQLKRIVSAVDDEPAQMQPQVGVLTAMDRRRWGPIYQKLIQDPENAANVQKIASSMFVLALEQTGEEPMDQDVDESTQADRSDECKARQMLHGLFKQSDTANRWYDKTMQFVICRDGTCGLNFEHSCAEGVAVIRLIEHILQYMNEVKRWKLTRYSSISNREPPVRLKWNLPEEVHAEIAPAFRHNETVANNLDIHILRFQSYGRDFPKTVCMSPDSWIQLALQWTYYRTHGYLVPTYESASTRRFHLGRVDNIRASSLPALEWCKAMQDSTICTDEKIKLLRKAMDWQTEVMLENILGYGVDNHLLGLRKIAEESGLPTPDVFADETYAASNKFRLSTSQVMTTLDAFMCYGAVVPDGYGAAYNPHPKYMVVVITSWLSCSETDSAQFADNLETSFNQMRELVNTNIELAKQKSSEPLTWRIPEENST